jgi:serine protease Do
MSFDNHEIYNDMEKSSRGGSGVIQKLVASVLFLSIGFAIGNVYKVAKTPETQVNDKSELPIIETVSTKTPKQVATKGEALSIKEIANMNQDSIVEIKIATKATSSYFGTYTTTGSGSGIIISKDGYILTNNHVIEDASDIKIKLHDGTEYDAKVVGSDSKTDVGIIKIEANNLQPVKIGNSDLLSVGDTAVVIGNPLGELGGTVTNGIISALEREMNIEGTKMNLIQTNAAINPGNSGGGMFNSNGELVGIVVAKSSGLNIEGLGFAIPINDVADVINDILELGYVSGRPYLGVELSDTKETKTPYSGGNSIFDFFYGDFDSYTKTSYGAYVKYVEEGSAADEAGIEVDDQIISIDGEMCSSTADVSNAIAEHEVGDTISIGIVRNKKMLSLKATLKEYTGSNEEKDSKEEQKDKKEKVES